MIHVVTAENFQDYRSYLVELWKQRYQVFVEKLGWELDCQEGVERDQYDTDNTVYLLSIDDNGKLKGSMRLLPTAQNHLMTDIFPDLCATEVPRGSHIWEISRVYSLTGRHMLLERDRTLSELICGMYEFALENGIKQISTVSIMSMFPTVLKAGWNVEPLGLPQVIDGEVVIAFLIDLTEEHYEVVRTNRGVQGSVLFHDEAAPLKVAV